MLKEVFGEKLKGVQAHFEKYSMVIAANLTSIGRVHKEKIVKNH